MTVLDYIRMGVLALFQRPGAFSLLSLPISIILVMVLAELLLGIMVGATPRMAVPVAMAIYLPILISVFGYRPDALLPAVGFLIGILKGAPTTTRFPLFRSPRPIGNRRYMERLWPRTRQTRSSKTLNCLGT